jgi:hypothetical protein
MGIAKVAMRRRDAVGQVAKRFLLTFLLFCVFGNAQQKPAKTYPESGMVVAVRAGSPTKNVRYSMEYPTHVYRIETESRFYEAMDKGKVASLDLAQSLEFRVDKDKLCVWVGKKEKKYDITAVEDKPKNATAKDK